MINFEYKPSYDVNDFRNIIKLLRSNEGCPWDREQTHESIRLNLLEEAYEVCEAIDDHDSAHLKEELGDLMMQIIFHSRIEEEAGRFDLDDVADGACKKLINRHPHIFSDVQVKDTQEVLKNWDEIKRVERAQDSTASAMDSVAKSLPALWRAEKIQKKAAQEGFDWPDLSGAMDKLAEESAELGQAIKTGRGIQEELGDVLFAVVNASRFLGFDPEEALHRSCDKFIKRFQFIETEAQRKGKRLQDMSLDEMEEIYQQGKRKNG